MGTAAMDYRLMMADSSSCRCFDFCFVSERGSEVIIENERLGGALKIQGEISSFLDSALIREKLALIT